MENAMPDEQLKLMMNEREQSERLLTVGVQARRDLDAAADSTNHFYWSKRRSRIRRLVREFSEQTTAEY
jgi:hypothetical protein